MKYRLICPIQYCNWREKILPISDPSGKQITERIRQLIASRGPISFAQFMEEVLYAPNLGYYNSFNPIGASGDFFTSPSAHPIFGALIAIQIQEMWTILGKPDPFTVLEFGAGQGLLGRDILSFIKSNHPKFFTQLNYVLIDRVEPTHYENSKADRILTNHFPFKNITGCIISNELFDSFPVHRFKIQNGTFHEILVNWGPNGFTEVLREIKSPSLLGYLNDNGIHNLPDGFEGEISLQPPIWLESAIASLNHGFILTIDYGGRKEDIYSSRNYSGTLRCFYKHMVVGNPYQRIGQQDITSNVNFSALIDSGKAKGVPTLALTTQREFLINLGMGDFLKALAQSQLPNQANFIPALSQKEYLANRMAALQLINPDGLGAFKVLLQGKDVPDSQLCGINPRNEPSGVNPRGFASAYLPVRDQERTPLFEGRFPDQALIPDDIWPWG